MNTEKPSSWAHTFSSYFTLERMIFTLLGIGFVVYVNSFFNGFVMDDQGLILNNKNIQSFSIINFFRGSIFDFGGSLGGVYYRPLQSIIFSSLYSMFGAHAFFYHFVQVVLHTVNAILVLLVLRKFLWEKVAFVAALVFLVHPIQVDAVAYIASMQDVLYQFFGLLFLLSLMNYYEKRYMVTLPYSLLLCAMLSKESGFLYLPLGLTYIFLFQRKHLLFHGLLAGGTLGIYLFLRVLVAGMGIHSTSEFAMMRLSLSERIIHIPAIVWYYLKTFFYPVDLVAVQSWVIRSITVETFFAPLLLVTLFFMALVYCSYHLYRRNKLKEVLFFASWFVLGLLLHIQLTPLDVTVGERYFYFPMVGLLGMLGLFFIYSALPKTLRNHQSVVVSLLILIVALLAIRTVVRNFDWRDSRALALHDLQIQKDNYQLLSSLGAMYLAEENYDKAIHYLGQSVAIYPYWGVSQYNLAVSYHLNNRAELAEMHYKKAIANAPLYINAYENMAILLLQEDPAKARAFTKQHLKKFPGSLKMWHALALAETKLGNSAAASEAAKMFYILKTSGD